MADKDINESQLANPSSPTKANKSHHGLTASSSTINSPARKLEVSPKHNVAAQMRVTSSAPSSSVSLQSVDTHQRRPAALATSTKAEPTPMSPTGRASQSLHQMALDGSSSHAISARKFALGVRDERLGKVQTGSTRVPVGAITHRATSPLKSHDETPAVQAEVSSGRTASSVAPHETASTSVTTGALAAKAPSAGDLASRLPIVDLTASRFPPPPSPMSASPTRLSTQEGAGPQPPLPPPPPPLFVLNSSDGSQPHLERKPTASNVSTDNAPIPSSLLDAIRGASKSQLRKVSLSVSSVPNKNGSNALPPLFRSASLSLSTPLKPDLQSELRAKLTQKRGSIESSKRPTDDDSGSDWA